MAAVLYSEVEAEAGSCLDPFYPPAQSLCHQAAECLL